MNDTDARAAAAVCEKLKIGLTHPGNPEQDQPAVSIPMLPFRTTVGMPPEMAEQVGLIPKLLAEAIIHTIREAGISLVDTTELTRLQQDSAAPGAKAIIECRRCHTELLHVTLKGPHAAVDGPTLLKTLLDRSPACPH